MLSVFDTLKETLFLWVRNFWYLVALTLVTGTPLIIFNHYDHFLNHSHLSGIIQIFFLIGLFCSLVLAAAKAAAVLGLLRRGPQENVEYAIIWNIVKNSTWTLFQLSILIALIAILLLIPFALVMRIAGSNKFVILFVTTFYFFLVKYALANPLVVVENLNAREALKQSWEMTKGHFGYVLGCYIFLWLGDWLINWAILWPVDIPDSSMSWTWLPVHLGAEFINSLWLILSWCMYLRIKEAEAQA